MSDKVKFTIVTDVFDENDKLVFRGHFDWFVRRKSAMTAKSFVKTSGDK